MAERLFTTDQGIHTDITSLFMRADALLRRQLIEGMSIIAAILPDGASPSHEHPILQGRARSKSFQLLTEVFGDDMENWDIRSFFEEAALLDKNDVLRVAEELDRIATGEITPTSVQTKQLHNLSNNGLFPALRLLELDVDTIQFPLLDVGTGREAYFAQDLLKKRPGQTIVSTSLHLAGLHSPMRDFLSQTTDRGTFVACDGTNLPFADESFATVVSMNADPYYTPLSELPQSLREKYRVLRTGGMALLCPAFCDYGERIITDDDIEPLQSEMDISLRLIDADFASQQYRGDDQISVIKIQK